MRLQTGVCETLLLDVLVAEMHQNDCRYVCEFCTPTFDSPTFDSPTFDSLDKNLAWLGVTRRT